MKLVIFALIPLILSIGLTPVIPFSDAVESNQICVDKVWIENSKGKIACVTPSTADKLVERGWGTLFDEDNFEKQPDMKKDGQEIIQTRIGSFALEGNYLSVESDQSLKDEIFFQRAIQVYHLALPAIGGAGIFYEQDKVGATPGDALYWSDFMNSDTETLTGNISSLYLASLQDLSEGPLVVDVPPGGILGHIDNIYQQVIIDIGKNGPYKTEGGLILILPPGYDDEIPEGYFVAQSDTMQIILIARSFVGDTGSIEAAVDQNKKLNIYKLSEADNPPKVKMFDVHGKQLKLAHPTTDGFWEFLHEVYSKEHVIRPEDKHLIGLMHAIGIVPGEPFEPDEHSKKLLDEAAIVSDLMMKSIAFNSPVKAPYIYYPNANWELGFMTDNPNFEDERGATQMEPRQSFAHQAITTAEAMVLDLRGAGSKYLLNYRDANSDWLSGSNLYKLNIPANPPVENFWSIVVYDVETRSMIQNGVQLLPGIRSLDADNMIQNDDGSYDAYFGPEAPEGYENNWVKTNEGDGWFVIFRFYAPTEGYYDKSWQLPNIEKIE